MAETFVREFEIESLKKTLQIQQKLIGDVSCVVWDAAIVLSRYIELECSSNKELFINKNIIEIGAGVGCAGLVASCFGANVIMTDLPEVLDNLLNNIEHNKSVWKTCGGSAIGKPLKWGSTDVQTFHPPDFLIASDCIYYEESVEPLIETMVALCHADTEVLLCQEERDTEKQQRAWRFFLELFDKYFDYSKVPRQNQHELYSAEEIVILKGKKKSQLNINNLCVT